MLVAAGLERDPVAVGQPEPDALVRQNDLGLSRSALLREARQDRARQLPVGGAGSVSGVACAVGYRSVSRAYRQRYGVSPSEEQAG